MAPSPTECAAKRSSNNESDSEPMIKKLCGLAYEEYRGASNESAECSTAHHVIYQKCYNLTPVIINCDKWKPVAVSKRIWGIAMAQQTLYNTAIALSSALFSEGDLRKRNNATGDEAKLSELPYDLRDLIARASVYISQMESISYDVNPELIRITDVYTTQLDEIHKAFLEFEHVQEKVERMIVVDLINSIRRNLGTEASNDKIAAAFAAKLATDISIIMDKERFQKIQKRTEFLYETVAKIIYNNEQLGNAILKTYFGGEENFPRTLNEVMAKLTLLTPFKPQEKFSDKVFDGFQWGRSEQELIYRRRDKYRTMKNVVEAVGEISRSSFRSYYRRINGGDGSKDPNLNQSFISYVNDPDAITVTVQIARFAKWFCHKNYIVELNKAEYFTNDVQLTRDEFNAALNAIGKMIGSDRMDIYDIQNVLSRRRTSININPQPLPVNQAPTDLIDIRVTFNEDGCLAELEIKDVQMKIHQNQVWTLENSSDRNWKPLLPSTTTNSVNAKAEILYEAFKKITGDFNRSLVDEKTVAESLFKYFFSEEQIKEGTLTGRTPVEETRIPNRFAYFQRENMKGKKKSAGNKPSLKLSRNDPAESQSKITNKFTCIKNSSRYTPKHTTSLLMVTVLTVRGIWEYLRSKNPNGSLDNLKERDSDSHNISLSLPLYLDFEKFTEKITEICKEYASQQRSKKRQELKKEEQEKLQQKSLNETTTGPNSGDGSSSDEEEDGDSGSSIQPQQPGYSGAIKVQTPSGLFGTNFPRSTEQNFATPLPFNLYPDSNANLCTTETLSLNFLDASVTGTSSGTGELPCAYEIVLPSQQQAQNVYQQQPSIASTKSFGARDPILDQQQQQQQQQLSTNTGLPYTTLQSVPLSYSDATNANNGSVVGTLVAQQLSSQANIIQEGQVSLDGISISPGLDELSPSWLASTSNLSPMNLF